MLRDLHSFPTRRSSDLVEMGVGHARVDPHRLAVGLDGEVALALALVNDAEVVVALRPGVLDLDAAAQHRHGLVEHVDRKSTRLNSSHTVISYAVFCLKK